MATSQIPGYTALDYGQTMSQEEACAQWHGLRTLLTWSLASVTLVRRHCCFFSVIKDDKLDIGPTGFAHVQLHIPSQNHLHFSLSWARMVFWQVGVGDVDDLIEADELV